MNTSGDGQARIGVHPTWKLRHGERCPAQDGSYQPGCAATRRRSTTQQNVIPIKTGKQIEGMRTACGTARDILLALADFIRPGVTTKQVDDLAAGMMKERDCKSAFLGYRGFPGHICISTNEEVVHGIGGPRVVRYGDIVKIDVGIIKNGWVGDNALTVPVGIIDSETERLLKATEDALHVAIEFARAGTMLGDLCASVERHVKPQGFSVVREYVGHGVGRQLHEEPQVPNFRPRNNRPKLRPGMVLAIEPMVNLGTARTITLEDGWTVVTADRKPSAHFEHTVLVTDGDPEILTWRERRMRAA